MNTPRTFAIIAVLAFFLFSVLLLAGDWYSSYKKALEAIEQQQWEAAVEQLNLAIAEKPESKASITTSAQRIIDYFPYLYRGIAHYHLGNLSQAEKDLEKELAANQVRDNKIALGELQKYQSLLKQPLDKSYEKALELFANQEWKAAMEQLSLAIAVKPESKANVATSAQSVIDYFPYLYRGIAHYQLGHDEAATVDLEKEISFGEVLQAATDKTAARELQKYLNLVSQRRFAWYKSYKNALEAIGQQQWEKAVEQLNAALVDKSASKADIKLYSQRVIDYFPYLYRGIAHYHLGNLSQAGKDLEKELAANQVRDNKTALGELQKYQSLLKQSWDKSYEKALELFANQEWKAAMEQLSLAIVVKPESKANVATSAQHVIDYFPYLYRGIAHYHSGNIEQAWRDLEKELASREVRLATTDKDASGKLQQYITFVKQRQLAAPKFNEALALLNQKQYDTAKNRFFEVLKIDPNHAEAAKYLKSMEDEETKAALAKAEAEKKAAVDKEFESGVQAFGERNFDEAEKYFNRVLALDKAYSGAADYLEKIKAERARVAAKAQIEKIFNEGVSLFEAADWNGAEARFITVLKLDSAYASLNRVFVLDKTSPGAADYLERITRVAVRAQIETIFNEGISLFEAYDWNGAEAKFNAILKLDSAYAGANDYLKRLAATRAETAKAFREGERLYKNQEWDRAEEAFLTVIRLNKNDARASSYLNKIVANRGDLATSQRVESLFNDGVTSFNNGDLKNAKTKFLNAQLLDSSNASVKERLNAISQVEKSIRDGVAAFFEGSYDQSIAQLGDALRLYGASTEARVFLGCALATQYFLSGEEDKNLYKNALDHFNTVKRLDANYKLDGNAVSPKIITLFEKN